LLSIPFMHIEDESFSIYQAVVKAQQDSDFLEKLPVGLQNILKSTLTREQIIVQEKPLFEKKGFAEIGDFPLDGLPVEYDVYTAFHDLNRQLLSPAIKTEGLDFLPTFYASPENSNAHFVPGYNLLGWNLYYMDEKAETLGRILRKEIISPQEVLAFYEQLATTGSHEYQHRRENTAESLTHNREFSTGQEEILEMMIQQANPAAIEADLQGKYEGNYRPAAELSKRQAGLL